MCALFVSVTTKRDLFAEVFIVMLIGFVLIILIDVLDIRCPYCGESLKLCGKGGTMPEYCPHCGKRIDDDMVIHVPWKKLIDWFKEK